MAETDYGFDYELDNLIDNLITNVNEDTKEFNDLINLEGCLNREIYINDIVEGTGQSVDGYVRFWNHYDEIHHISVEDRDPIKIYIDSNGGSLLDTFTIIDSIKLSKTPVYTIVIGTAYSGGFFIAISGHKRYCYPHASYLFHEGSVGNSGTASQFENYTAFYKKELGKLKEHTLEFTNISEDEYSEIRKDDVWYDAEEAIEKGIVDEIIGEFI